MKTIKLILRSCAVVALALPLMANQSCDKVEARKLRKRIGLISPTNSITSQPFTLPGNKVYANLGVQVSAQLKKTLHDSKDFYLFERIAPRGISAMSNMDCVEDYPMYTIQGTIPYFEFTSKTKVTFGYSKTGDYGTIVASPSVEVERAELDLYLETFHPISGVLNGMGEATSASTKTTFKATVGYNDFNVTPEIYAEKPIGKVTQKALDKAIEQLTADTADDVWYAQVVQDFDRNIMINAGRNSGLKKGDVLEVYNQVYFWKNNGTPCQVPLIGQADKHQGKPDAVIVLEDVQSDVSYSNTDPERPTEEPILPGAIVRVRQLAP